MNTKLDQMFSVAGKVVVVTGGCGGIGSGLAKGLAELEARVAIIDINQEKLDGVVKTMIEETGAEVRGYACNITDEADVERVFAKINKDFGSVYGLINCAGISHVTPLSEMPIDRWQAVMDVNVRGTVICTKIAGKYMYKNNKVAEVANGRVINISSLAATHGKPKYTAYTPSKAAINGFTFTLAAEWSRLGITVNSVSPVMVVTDINRKQVEENPMYLQQILDVSPQGRLCSPELLLGSIVFLLSDASSFMTGQNIGCDGGSQNGDIAIIKPVETM